MGTPGHRMSNRDRIASSRPTGDPKRPSHSPRTTRHFLIATLAIRISFKSSRIRHNSDPNRHKTHTPRSAFHPRRSSHPPLTTHRCLLLIGPPVIRIRPKPFVFITDSKSNRHKTVIQRGIAVLRPTPLTFVGRRLQPLDQPMTFLIGPPVIRIHPKSFRISDEIDSNRHRTHTSPMSVLSPYGNLYRTSLSDNGTKRRCSSESLTTIRAERVW